MAEMLLRLAFDTNQSINLYIKNNEVYIGFQYVLCFRPVSCVSNIVSVSGLCIHDCSFSFLQSLLSPVSCLHSTASVWIIVFCRFLCVFCVFICFAFCLIVFINWCIKTTLTVYHLYRGVRTFYKLISSTT